MAEPIGGSSPASARARDLLLKLFRTAVGRASAAERLPPLLPPPPRGRTVVIAAGKAAAVMARATELAWPGPLSGIAITRYGHAVPCERIEVVEAGHPLPDDAGTAATSRALILLESLSPDDLVIFLVSGGGSALLSAPAGGVSLAEKRLVTTGLLRSGATIGEINCVRKHLSAVKGGRLALAAAPASTLTIAISDVPGDDPAAIASGPSVADPTTREQALRVLERYGLEVAPAVRRWLEDPASETPKRLPPGDFVMLATPAESLAAAADAARAGGYEPLVLGDDLEGEARLLAERHARIALDIRNGRGPAAAPCVVLSGGEASVTVTGSGRGGRNAEFLLALALELDGAPGVHALAADTDGIDGTEDNAGAVIDPGVLARAADLGLDAASLLAGNDAYRFFERTGDLLVTGPTLTNVNDFRAILIDAL